MTESWETRLLRWKFNVFPAYWGTGARCTYIQQDYKEIRVKLPLTWRTRNYVGTIFGGSIYGAVDPMYMIMLIKILGPKYVVWDKSASVRFRRPGRGPLYATFRISDEEVQAILEELRDKPKLDRQYQVDLVDDQGVVHATVEKVIHVSHK